MALLKLKADPTFKAKVGIPVAGGQAVPVEMTFRHRTRTELAAFRASLGDRQDIDIFMDLVVDWHEVEQPFSRETANELLENYGGAAVAVWDCYQQELLRGREKN